ncbi:MAG: peptidoglycan DD-metalloendopeptidase family protein [Kofleriaceae bacterium]|nr:peptidoglycan DD-metalloendopeptidase family protein [Kofleriaceae bacterium]
MRSVRAAPALAIVAGLALGGAPVVDAKPQPSASELRREQARTAVVKSWHAQAEALDRTRITVQSKADAAIAQRAQQARTAALTLAHHVANNSADAMDNARRRAAAKLVLARERAEVLLLTDERDHLVVASDAIGDGTATAITLAMPPTDLVWPADGSIARSFGTYMHTRTKTTLSRRGIDLEVEEHASAHAAAAGIVRYSGPIRGLDNGVIIDHGTYLTVLAKLGKLTRTVGATLGAGDTVGRAASSRLYLEVRVKVGPEGTPVDPQLFLRKRSE